MTVFHREVHMKQIKRMAVLLIAASFLLLTPVSALAAKQEYVPTKAVYYELDEGNWVKTFEETYSCTKNGRIKSYTYKSLLGNTGKTTYTWKGNYLKKAEDDYSIDTYSYKKKKLKSSTEVEKLSGKATTISVSWKKKKGTFTSGSGNTGTMNVNKRNQMIQSTTIDGYGRQYTTALKYYANGNLKSHSYHSYSAPNYSYILKYNKKGYPVSFKSTTTEGSFKYKKNKKGQIKEQLVTFKYDDGGVYTYKKVFSKYKKISRSVRNCDAFGNIVMTPYSVAD